MIKWLISHLMFGSKNDTKTDRVEHELDKLEQTREREQAWVDGLAKGMRMPPVQLQYLWHSVL